MTTPTIANAENIMEIFKTENMTLVILVGIFQNQSSATIARPAPLLEESWYPEHMTLNIQYKMNKLTYHQPTADDKSEPSGPTSKWVIQINLTKSIHKSSHIFLITEEKEKYANKLN